MRKRINYGLTRIYNRIKVLSIELGIVLLAFISSCFAVVFLIRRVFLKKSEEFDQQVFEWWSGHVNDRLTDIMQFFTFFGSHLFLVPANLCLIAYAFFIKRDRWFALRTASVAITSLVLMFTMKFFFNRKRPVDPLLQEVSGLSFPSGHAMMSFTFFGLLIYIVYKKTDTLWLKITLIILFMLMIVMICLSRIYLRVHYATDVMAGFSMGIIWLVLSLWIIHIIEKHKSNLPPVQ
jgi:membrane-associated phospholipid phosphatase